MTLGHSTVHTRVSDHRPGQRTPVRRLGSWLSATAAVTGVILTMVTANPAAAVPATGTILGAGSPSAVPGSYLVVLDQDRKLETTATATTTTATGLADRYNGKVTRVFDQVLHGFAAQLTERDARRLAAHPAVARVEQDQRVHAMGSQTNPPSWGLDRIDQRYLPLDNTYNFGPSTGVRVYVLDTGIRITHTDFGGRASYGYDTVDNDLIAQDGHGHGTFVAGLIAGSTYGVAKDANVVAVRVLNDYGSGTTAAVVAGIDWVTSTASSPSVVNMSLGGPVSSILDQAVRASISRGITYTVAAGANGVNANTVSPARVTQALTVGITNRNDTVPAASNWGDVIDICAPGIGVTSLWNTGDSVVTTNSGTSFGTAHVAGAVALYLNANPTATPATVHSAIVSHGTTGIVPATNWCGSPGRLLYTGP